MDIKELPVLGDPRSVYDENISYSWCAVKLPGVFRPSEAGERRSSLCNLTLQSFPFLSISITRHEYLFISRN